MDFSWLNFNEKLNQPNFFHFEIQRNSMNLNNKNLIKIHINGNAKSCSNDSLLAMHLVVKCSFKYSMIL